MAARHFRRENGIACAHGTAASGGAHHGARGRAGPSSKSSECAAAAHSSLSDGSQIRERRLQVSAVDVLREDGSRRTATLVQTSSVGWDTTIYPHCVFVDNPYCR
jgi:hypothetical protein